MNEVEIFGFLGSTYVRTVQMVCEEKAVKYKLSPLEFGADSHYNLHPYGKMPAAKIGDVSLFESLAISTYIDELSDGEKLHPTDPLNNALMLQWISSFIDYVYDDLVRSIAGNEELGTKECEKAFDTLKNIDKSMDNSGYLVGQELTLADLYLAPMLAFALSTLDNLDDMANSLQSLNKWQQNIFDRESFKNTEIS